MQTKIIELKAEISNYKRKGSLYSTIGLMMVAITTTVSVYLVSVKYYSDQKDKYIAGIEMMLLTGLTVTIMLLGMYSRHKMRKAMQELRSREFEARISKT